MAGNGPVGATGVDLVCAASFVTASVGTTIVASPRMVAPTLANAGLMGGGVVAASAPREMALELGCTSASMTPGCPPWRSYLWLPLHR